MPAGPAAEAKPPDPAHHRQVEDRRRERAIDLAQLWHVADLTAATVEPGRTRAKDLDPTGPGFEQPEHHLDQGALAASIGADQRRRLPARQAPTGTVQHWLLVVAGLDVLQQQRPVGRGHWTYRSAAII